MPFLLAKNVKLPQMPRVKPLSDRGEWVQIWIKFFQDLVLLVLQNASVALPILTVTANYTTTNSDYTILVDASLNPVTITLDNGAGKGKMLNIKIIDASNLTTVDGDGKDIDGSATQLLRYNHESLTLHADENNDWWIV